MGRRHLPTAPATQALATALGEALAALHRLQVPCGEDAQVDPWYRAAHGATHWRPLANRAAQANRRWARRLEATLPLLAEVEALVAAQAAEAVPLRVCHSDLVPGNVLVAADGRPVLLDWDDAGPWNTSEELAAALVSWSTGPQGEPCEQVAAALVQGYQRAGGVIDATSPTVLAGSVSAVANWLELQLRRSLDATSGDRAAQRAEAEVTHALDELAWLMTWRQRWTDICLGDGRRADRIVLRDDPCVSAVTFRCAQAAGRRDDPFFTLAWRVTIHSARRHRRNVTIRSARPGPGGWPDRDVMIGSSVLEAVLGAQGLGLLPAGGRLVREAGGGGLAQQGGDDASDAR